MQIYVLQNSLLLAKLVFKGSSKHSSCNKVLQASCLPSRFHKTKFSWISTVCKYLRKHCVIIFFPPRISSYKYCQLVTTTDDKTRIIYFCFRRFLEFQIVSFFPHKHLEFYILGHHSKSSRWDNLFTALLSTSKQRPPPHWLNLILIPKSSLLLWTTSITTSLIWIWKYLPKHYHKTFSSSEFSFLTLKVVLDMLVFNEFYDFIPLSLAS